MDEIITNLKFASPFYYQTGEHIVGSDSETRDEHIYLITGRSKLGTLYYYTVRIIDEEYEEI